MEIGKYFLLYAGTLISFLVFDSLWLGFVAKNYYRENLKHLIAKNFNKFAAISFYLIFVLGILIFAVSPALNNGDGIKAITLGGLFGFFTYATYDLTNLSTLKNWPIKITIIDIFWGIILTSAVSAAGYYIGRQLGF